ncbi:MAG: hypothetical protein U0794_16565 [Isosphaeraceae bacterium]
MGRRGAADGEGRRGGIPVEHTGRFLFRCEPRAMILSCATLPEAVRRLFSPGRALLALAAALTLATGATASAADPPRSALPGLVAVYTAADFARLAEESRLEPEPTRSRSGRPSRRSGQLSSEGTVATLRAPEGASTRPVWQNLGELKVDGKAPLPSS